jgi:hypothetical protein
MTPIRLAPCACWSLRSLPKKQPARPWPGERANRQESRRTAASTICWPSCRSRARTRSGGAATAQKAMQLNPEDGEAVTLFAQLQVQRGQRQCDRRLGAMVQDASQRCRRLAHSRNPRGIARRCCQGRGLLQEGPANPAASSPVAANNLAYRMLRTAKTWTLP